MPRVRPCLIALLAAFGLFLLAFAAWFAADEPLDSEAITAAAGDRTPTWLVAQDVLGVCVVVVIGLLVLTGAVIAAERARATRFVARAAYGVAGLLTIGGPAVFLVAWLTHQHTPPAHPAAYLLALGVGPLAALGVLAATAVTAPQSRWLARAATLPATALTLVLLAVFAAIVAFAVDLTAHGVPIIGPDLSVTTYPITALPAGLADWLVTLAGSLLSSLAALAAAGYASLAVVRGAQTTPAL